MILYGKLVCLSRELPRTRERKQHNNKGFFGQPWREERGTVDEEKERRGKERRGKERKGKENKERRDEIVGGAAS